MTIFEQVVQTIPLTCDVCGGTMTPVYGGGWDYDKIVCQNYNHCGGEITFCTSTELPKQDDDGGESGA